MKICGIDDAGRGPVIGPMILAGVLMTKEQEKHLKGEGVADSKLLEHSTRMKLEKTIKENSLKSHVAISQANEIDSSILSGTNLNTLEAKEAAHIINEINQGKFTKEKIKVFHTLLLQASLRRELDFLKLFLHYLLKMQNHKQAQELPEWKRKGLKIYQRNNSVLLLT